MTGTGPNLVLKGILSEMSDHSPINVASWMFFAVPSMLINVFLCWVWLQAWFLGFGNMFIAIKQWIRNQKVKLNYCTKILLESKALDLTHSLLLLMFMLKEIFRCYLIAKFIIFCSFLQLKWSSKASADIKHNPKTDQERRIRDVLQISYDELGPISFHEVAVLFLFISLVLMWLLMDPKFMTGWGNFVKIM